MKELVIFTSLPQDVVLGVMEKFFRGVAFVRLIFNETAMKFTFGDTVVSLYMLNELKAALQELDTEILDTDFQIVL